LSVSLSLSLSRSLSLSLSRSLSLSVSLSLTHTHTLSLCLSLSVCLSLSLSLSEIEISFSLSLDLHCFLSVARPGLLCWLPPRGRGPNPAASSKFALSRGGTKYALGWGSLGYGSVGCCVSCAGGCVSVGVHMWVGCV